VLRLHGRPELPSATGGGPRPLGRTGSRPAAVPPEIDLARWWTVFDDPTLVSLEERAVRSNLDLKLAKPHSPSARGTGHRHKRTRSTVDATELCGAAGTRPDLRLEKWETAAWSRTPTMPASTPLELDIFGGIRRNIEAADADLQAAEETRRDVLVTLTAEVARNYIELRAFQQRIEIARRTWPRRSTPLG